MALTAAALVALSAPARAQGMPPEAETAFTEKPLLVAAHEMVIAADPRAAEAGLAVLRQGGNAVDAAVAVAFVLGLVEPQSSGLGGGAFLTAWRAKDGTMRVYDGRETAPKAAGPDLFKPFLDAQGQPSNYGALAFSGASVGVPGMVRMLELAQREQGVLPWAALAEPAIALAADGTPVSQRLNALTRIFGRRLRQDETAAAYLFEADGTPKAAGAIIKNPAYAETLRAIAARGADALHTGRIAADIVAAARREPAPSPITVEDLADYRPVARTPTCAPYRGFTLCGPPPPSSGAVTVAEILGLLQAFDLPRMAPNGAEALHLFAEASRLAFADRERYLGDPDFVKMPLPGLLSPDYLAARAKLIDPARTLPKAEAGSPAWREGRLERAPGVSPEFPSTSHLIVVDKDGNVVSMTASIQLAFGAMRMVDGFFLNNELTDFSFVSEVDGVPVANRVEGGKRPRSSMAPMIVLGSDKRPVAAVGSPGGALIIEFVAQALVEMLDWNLDPQAAVSAPHVSGTGRTIELEAGREALWPIDRLSDGLKALGETVAVHGFDSGLAAVRIGPGKLQGGADPRREGRAVGD